MSIGYKGVLREHSALTSWLMPFLDAVVIVLASLLAHWVYFGNFSLPDTYKFVITLSLLLGAVIFPPVGLYRNWRGAPLIEELVVVLVSLLALFGLMAILAFLTKTSDYFSRMWTGIWFCISLISMSFCRGSLRGALAYLRRSGFNLRHVVVIGAGQIGEQVVGRLMSSPESGFKVVGYFKASDDGTTSPLEVSYETGGVSDISRYLAENDIDQVWIAVPSALMGKVDEILSHLGDSLADIRLVPDIFAFSLMNHSFASVEGLPVLNLSVTPMDGINRLIKSVEDKLLASVILLLISPVMLLIAAGVKLSSPGPVLYRQQRVSWNGKTFDMYKFRSMPVDVEQITGAVWARAGEDRATPFGRFLRKTSLDELPQFLNVLKGDMSIVGPRPERPFFVERFKEEIPGYMKKHLVKAGITGWAQVNGWRGDTDLKMRIEHDLYYIENWSLTFDLKIIFLTLAKGFVNRNAY